mgnify:CR=1 FL=1
MARRKRVAFMTGLGFTQFRALGGVRMPCSPSPLCPSASCRTNSRLDSQSWVVLCAPTSLCCNSRRVASDCCKRAHSSSTSEVTPVSTSASTWWSSCQGEDTGERAETGCTAKNKPLTCCRSAGTRKMFLSVYNSNLSKFLSAARCVFRNQRSIPCAPRVTGGRSDAGGAWGARLHCMQDNP